MVLYLMQHGEAVDKAVDPERPLSAKGRADVERIATFVAQAGVRVSHTWHSGKTRARQTAELLAQQVGGTLAEVDGLQPDDDVRAAVKRIERERDATAIVGHLPHLARLAGKLLRCKGDDAAPILFQRGGIAALERGNGGAWQLRWMIIPELLGR